jgi:hypothetical protein
VGTAALGAAAGGLLAAAFVPMAVANADEFIYNPDPLNYLPVTSTIWAIPGLISGADYVGDWNTGDITAPLQSVFDSLSGHGTETNILSLFSYYDTFTVSSNISDPSGLAPGSVIDYASTPLGANELIDAAAGSTTPGITDWLLTPFGNFLLF